MKKTAPFVSVFIASLLLISSAFAENPLCDREIEGVTVKMTLQQARAIWLSRGFIETTGADPKENRGKTSTVTFVNRIKQPGERTQGDFSLEFNDLRDQVSVRKSFATNDSVTKARIAEFCPNGPSRGGKLSCLFARVGVNISVSPEDPQTPGRCSYQFATRGGQSTENIVLDRKPAQLPSVNKFGRPAPKRGPAGN